MDFGAGAVCDAEVDEVDDDEVDEAEAGGRVVVAADAVADKDAPSETRAGATPTPSAAITFLATLRFSLASRLDSSNWEKKENERNFKVRLTSKEKEIASNNSSTAVFCE